MRGFPLVENGTVISPESRLVLDFTGSCLDLRERDFAPELMLQDGTPIASSWVPFGRPGLIVREGPSLPPASVIVVRDDWGAECQFDSCNLDETSALSCDLATQASCCEALRADGASVEWFRFHTAPTPHHDPPPPPGRVPVACRTGRQGTFTEDHRDHAGTDFVHHILLGEPPEVNERLVAEIRLYVDDDVSSSFAPSLGAVWARARADAGETYYYDDAPDPDATQFLEPKLVARSQDGARRTTFRFFATSLDLVRHESERGPVTELTVPDDCPVWPGAVEEGDAGAETAADSSRPSTDAGAPGVTLDAAMLPDGGRFGGASSDCGCRAAGRTPVPVGLAFWAPCACLAARRLRRSSRSARPADPRPLQRRTHGSASARRA